MNHPNIQSEEPDTQLLIRLVPALGGCSKAGQRQHQHLDRTRGCRISYSTRVSQYKGQNVSWYWTQGLT